MRSAHFGSVYVTIGVLLERAIILTKHKSREDDSLIAACTRLQTVDVLLGIRRITDHQQPVSSSHLFESLDNEVSIVLRLEPRHVQNVSIRLHSPLAHGGAIRPSLYFTPVSDHRR